MADFPITEAQLVGLFLESVFWGIYLVTFFLCLRALLFNAELEPRRLRDLNWPMLALVFVMGTFATLDVVVGLLHNIQAFVMFKGPGGAAADFSNISDWVNIVKTVDVVAQTTIGDGMLIFRCWVVHSKSWRVVALSILLWLGGTACAAMILHVEATLHSSDTLITSSSLDPLILSFWVITIVQNILTTGLLICHIWRVDRKTAFFAYRSDSQNGQTRLGQAIRVIIESGLMYTAIAILTCITQVANSNSTYGISDVEVQVVGITFNLIIIRAHRSTGGTEVGSTNLPLHTLRRQTAHFKDGVHISVTTDFRDEDGKAKMNARTSV
ncbi:hypothetical protein K438DRAFT_1712167 [Mycena galopus ATCC 62051]|nr:hypothetical protein K438DRAFT_1712167 [Mycena galopus ATCC 62051]